MQMRDVAKYKNRVARVGITDRLLLDSIGFPDETLILNCERNYDNGTIELLVSHPELPEVEHGKIIPLTSPIIKKVVYEWDWNVK